MIQGNRRVSSYWRQSNVLSCDPKEHDLIAASLNVIKSGTMLGEVIHDKLIPSHDLAMSVRINRELWNNYNASHDEAISFLRMDDFVPQGC